VDGYDEEADRSQHVGINKSEELEKMSRPAFKFPNFPKVGTRNDQEVQPLETGRQKEIFGRKVAQAHGTAIERRNAVSNRVAGKFNRRTLGTSYDTPKGPKSSALAGKLRSKFEAGDEDHQKKLAEHKVARNAAIREHNGKVEAYNKKFSEIRNKIHYAKDTAESVQAQNELIEHRKTSPKFKFKPAPRKKALETTKLSPKDAIARGRGVDQVIHHEAYHHTMSELERHYGKETAKKAHVGMLAQYDKDTLASVGGYIHHRLGYKPKDPKFTEEIMAHSRDILVNPSKRADYKQYVVKNHVSDKPDGQKSAHEKFDQHIKNLKAGHQKAYEFAQKFKPEDVKKSEELDKGAMQRLAPYDPHTVPKEKRLAVEKWTAGPVAGERSREAIPEMTPTERMRSLHRLHAQTPSRRNAQGEREFLLYRGMGHEEHRKAIQGKHVNHDTKSSWSPRPKLARDLAHYDYSHRPSGVVGEAPGAVVGAWVNEKHIHFVPNQIGSKHWDMDFDHEDPTVGPSPRRTEKEVIVHPHHNSEIHHFEENQEPGVGSAQDAFPKTTAIADHTPAATVHDRINSRHGSLERFKIKHGFKKSEELAKDGQDEHGNPIRGRNKRLQQAKVFGKPSDVKTDKKGVQHPKIPDANGPRRSPERMKMMNAVRTFTEKEHNTTLTIAQGKRDEHGNIREKYKDDAHKPFDVFTPKGHKADAENHAKLKAQGLKHNDPKPTWTDKGGIETQPSPDAAVHELGHRALAPSGMGLSAHQKHMDVLWGEYNRPAKEGGYGHMQQKKLGDEIQSMSTENKIRRMTGLPANRNVLRSYKPHPKGGYTLHEGGKKTRVKEIPPVEQAADGSGPRVHRAHMKDGTVHEFDRQSRLLNDENKKVVEARYRHKIEADHPEKGYHRPDSVHSKINTRAYPEHAQAKPKYAFPFKNRNNMPAQQVVDEHEAKEAAGASVAKPGKQPKTSIESYRGKAKKKPATIQKSEAETCQDLFRKLIKKV
jgi:hypothetical protein